MLKLCKNTLGDVKKERPSACFFLSKYFGLGVGQRQREMVDGYGAASVAPRSGSKKEAVTSWSSIFLFMIATGLVLGEMDAHRAHSNYLR